METGKNPMLLFDLDGTLWDSAEPVAESWNQVLAREAPQLPPLTGADVHGVMGLTMDQIRDTLYPGIPLPRRAEIFDECMNWEVEYLHDHAGQMYPDLRPVMESLRAAGYSTGIVSNCQTGYIGAFLHSCGVTDLFDDLEEWGRTGRPKGENIRLVMERNGFDRAIYIGDTAGDQQAARAAGIPFIHASYGFGTAQDPEGVIASLADLPREVRRLAASC